MPLSSSSTAAVARLRPRMLFLDQASLLHQPLVELFILLYPLRVLTAGGEGRLEGALADVIFVFRRVGHLTQKAYVPIRRFLRHARRPEDATEHIVRNVRAYRFLNRWNPAPVFVGNTLRIEYGERSHAFCLPVADAFGGVVDRGVHVFADEVRADLTSAFEWHVSKLHTLALLQQDGNDLVLLLRAC